MVDARILHTTAVLRDAILQLATDRPVSQITVADVTRAAGINRATFYSHAVSPGSLLADVLTPELDRIRADATVPDPTVPDPTVPEPTVPDPSGTDAGRTDAGVPRDGARGDDIPDPGRRTRAAIEAVVAHVVAHRDIYRHGLPDPEDGSLHHLLVTHFTVSSLEHIRALDPARRPDVIDEVAAGFVAQGFVGAIEAWLSGPRRSRKALVDTIVLSFPAWWD